MNQLAPLPSSVLPALVAAAGERASIRFLEFFAANIRNPHTRRAYARAAEKFLRLVRRCRRAVDRRRPAGARCHLDRGRDARIGRAERQATARRDPPSVRLVGHRPGRAGQPGRLGARAPARRDVGQTLVLDPAEARALLDSIDTGSHAGLRDRALIGLMVYSFARIGAALGMAVEDVYTQNRRLWGHVKSCA